MVKATDNSKKYIWGKRKNKIWLIVSIVVGVIIIAGVAGYFIFLSSEDTSQSNDLGKKIKESLTRRAIDGVYVPDDQINHYPLGIMIENLVSSRPPAGLSKANLVYEALAEGGITRFLAIYAEQLVDIPEIGPIRSARSYYLDWALEYNALYVHIGGSPQSFTEIKQYDVFDLNQFYNSQYFWRDSERAAPHNLYSSGEKMAFALRDKEAPEQGDYHTWKFKDDPLLADRTTEDKNITIDFSSFNYKVLYKYNRQQNDYQREMAGQPHEDEDGTQIRAKNVVVQKVKTSLADNEQRLSMETIGEGEALVFMDGQVIEGTWKKTSRTDRTLFYDSQSDEIEFNAGTTWIEIVPIDREVIYN